MTDMEHPRYDLVMAYSEALDRHGLIRPPVSPIDEESHDDLVSAFFLTQPDPAEDPAETTASEELELFAAYAEFLAFRGELADSVIITPKAVADRVYSEVNRRG